MNPGSIKLLLAATVLAASTSVLAQKTQLTVYTALETDQIKAYENGFTKVNPNIEIKWVRDSTGVITAKLLAEKANPQADVVMGVAASSLALLDSQGMLVGYAPINLDAIMSSYRDKKNPPDWWGMDVWGATVCFNTVEAQKKGIPKPETWKDLTKPIYKGQVVMPNPASSGTGYFDVTAWLTLWGDDNGKGGGWKYMDALHENIAQYTHSGSKPCNMAAAGEYVIGISFEYRANSNKAKGAPIDLVFPKEGLGWDLEAFGIMKATKKMDAAKKLADWASSKDAMLLYGKNFAITAQPGVAAPQRAGRLREAPGQARLQERRRQPRARVGRVEQALRRQVRAEEVAVVADYLRLEGIRKSFGSFQALKDVDLAIAQGEFVCFLGPSGCGKTTLLRIIAGLETQTAGRIVQGDRDISRLPPAERDYGIVFQSYALFPNLSIADNVAYGLVNRKVPKARAIARVDELLKLVGLPGSGVKFPAQLSGGQQQRIALARALATSPGLLLLDEPLSALDALERVRLREEIRSLQRKLKVTTVMVTHDQEEALSVADRIVVMNHGVIEQVGSPLQIYREPATPFVADFVGKINVLSGRLFPRGELRIGSHRFLSEHDTAAERDVKIYLRPEDVLARPIAPGDANVFEGLIEKIEFLGSYCLVRVNAEAIAPEPLTVYLSLNFLAEQALEVGSRLPLKLLPERMRLF